MTKLGLLTTKTIATRSAQSARGRGNMTIRSFSAVFNQAIGRVLVAKMPLQKAVAFAAGLGLSLLSYPLHAAPASGGDTVQGLYDALLNTMKNGRTLGQSGRFIQLDPVIRRSFDIASMPRLSIGPSWASLTDAAAADDRKLRAVHFGDLYRALRQLCRPDARGDRRATRAIRPHGEEPDHQSQW
jgi:hypothetical protein